MVGILSSRCRQVGILLLGLVLVGCSSNSKNQLGNIEGKVTVDGTPANSGNVVFTSGGTNISGAIGPDGSYRVIGVALGEAQVAVTGPTVPTGAAGTGSAPAIKDMGGPSIGKPVAIPAKYGTAAKSGLTFTVKGGQNTYDIPLVSK
jgi:hypothetical protein